jgi:hypothetical protein
MELDIEEHSNKFQEIIEKYNLKSEIRANQIADLLTNSNRNKISSKDFSKLFGMQEEEATIFLSFIQKGLNFKKTHIDKE